MSWFETDEPGDGAEGGGWNREPGVRRWPLHWEGLSLPGAVAVVRAAVERRVRAQEAVPPAPSIRLVGRPGPGRVTRRAGCLGRAL